MRLKKIFKIFRRRKKERKVHTTTISESVSKLPESDYDGMGNFSRFGRPPK